MQPVLPFDKEASFAVFGAYDAAIWPVPIIAYALGVIAAAAASRFIAGVLALGWLWTGIAYHWLFFSSINPPARIFAAGFVLEAALILFTGGLRHRLAFGWSRGAGPIVGVLLPGDRLLDRPCLSERPELRRDTLPADHLHARTPPADEAVRPEDRPGHSPALVAHRGTAAFLLGVPQDWMMLLGGLGGAVLIAARDGGDQPFRTERPA
jgi:hypothetical protein